MTTYLLEDMAEYIAANTSYVGGTNLFASLIPDDIEGLVVGIFEYQGQPPQYVMGAANPLPAISNPHLQVVVRADPMDSGDAYPNAMADATTICEALETIVNETVNGTLYFRVARLQDPFLMDRDARRRIYIACNYEVMRQPS
jgi:hypothetical protein